MLAMKISPNTNNHNYDVEVSEKINAVYLEYSFNKLTQVSQLAAKKLSESYKVNRQISSACCLR